MTQLKTIADIQTGPFGSQLHKEDYVETGTPIVTVEHLGNRVFTEQNLPRVSDSDKARLIKYTLSTGDIVFSRVGSVDRCSYVDKSHDGWMFSGRCLRVRPTELVDSLYLYYYFCLEETKQFVRNIAVGATMPSINTKLLGEVEIALPDLNNQKRIAAVLSSLDDKIENNQKLNDNLQRQLRTIFKAEFTDNPELENITQIPLSELCHVVTKGTTPTTLGKPFVESGINFIKAESILDDHSIDKSKFAFIDEETNALLKRSIIHAGDVVFTIAGTLGRFALIDENVLPANTNQAVAIIRADLEKVLPEYIYTCFIGEWHTDYYAKRVQQAVQANLSLTTIKSLPIPLLDEAKMSEYLSLILPLIKAIKTNEAQNEKLAALRDNLLPKLMSGEIDVSAVQL